MRMTLLRINSKMVLITFFVTSKHDISFLLHCAFEKNNNIQYYTSGRGVGGMRTRLDTPVTMVVVQGSVIKSKKMDVRVV